MIKLSKFEEIISSSITKLRSTLNNEELTAFQAQLNALPKKIKELNAEPYLFVFESMLRSRELIDSALTSLASLIQQNYIAYPSYERVAAAINPLSKEYSYLIILLMQKIKEPHLAFLQLYFNIHSSVALPEDILKKFKVLGYSWLGKIFSLVEKEVPPFLMAIYSKFYPEQLGQLPRSDQQHQQIQKYVGLILQQKLIELEESFGQLTKTKGKKGFCFVCANSADYYCKDTKISVCGAECKKIHLQLIAKSSRLHSTYSMDFQKTLENVLVDNISMRKSPALSMDFLIAIYLYSNHIPQKTLPHSKIMSVPVIFQRIWLLYLSYYTKKGLCCEHILACSLSQSDSSFIKQMAAEYFILSAQDPKIFHIYNTFDKSSDFRLISFILRSIDKQHRPVLVQHLVKTAFSHYIPNNQQIVDYQRPLVRAFNHQKQLTDDILRDLFGESYEQKAIYLILRNQTEISKQKLGLLLANNEAVCRKFLQKIVKRKQGAPIDELLRQIFYFCNLKVSDKIYRLFQLLAQVYIPQHPFNQLNFFTYAYFVVMMVTEVNNPVIIQKPNEATMIARVQQFSPDLAQNHSHLLKEMLARVTGSPFQQNYRVLLSHYPDIPLEQWKEIRPEEIILLNWQILYDSALAGSLEVVTIYRICCMVASQPAVCQTFLQLLVDQLSAVNRDPFLVQAISNIIQTQPNAAGYLWKNILEQSLTSPNQPQNDSLHLGLIVHSTQRLTDDNFYQFTREFCSQINFTQKPDLMLRLISANLNRLGLISQLILNNFDKSDNYYQQITVVKHLCNILKTQSNEQFFVILLQMIRSIPILPITEAFVLEAFVSIDFDSLPHAQQFWSVVSQKSLEFIDEGRVCILQETMKSSSKCESYQSYLIQKTLNCHRKQLISEQILQNLHKLQPYLPDISKQVLALFISRQNLHTIAANFEYFSTINAAYRLILDSLTNIQQQNGNVNKQNLQSILVIIKELLQNDSSETILQLDQLPALLVQILPINWSTASTTLLQYVSLLVWQRSQLKQVTFIVTNISVITQHLSKLIQHKSITTSDDVQHKKERVQQIDALVKILYDLSRMFQTDIELRVQFKKFIKYNKSGLPSLLKTSILLCRAKFQLHKIAEEQTQIVFQKLLHQVQNVLQRQAQVQSQLRNKPKLTENDRLNLAEANKDALKYGELLIQESLDYLNDHKEIDKKQKGTLRRLLLQLLVQGFFDEQTCSFKALSGTALATQINEIFALLK